MDQDSDGIAEAVDSQMRTGVVMASHIGQEIAKLFEERRRAEQAENEQRSRELNAELSAQRNSARAMYANTRNDEWWAKSTPDDIRDVYETAKGWSAHDAEAGETVERMQDEVRTRYSADDIDEWLSSHTSPREESTTPPASESTRDGAEAAATLSTAAAVDAQQKRGERTGVDELVTDPTGLGEELRDRADTEKTAAQLDEAAGDRYSAAADDVNAEQETAQEPDEAEADHETADALNADADVEYDSSDRRDATAESLYSQGLSEENVRVRMTADVAQATPAPAAANVSKGKAAKASKGPRSGGRQRTPERTR